MTEGKHTLGSFSFLMMQYVNTTMRYTIMTHYHAFAHIGNITGIRITIGEGFV